MSVIEESPADRVATGVDVEGKGREGVITRVDEGPDAVVGEPRVDIGRCNDVLGFLIAVEGAEKSASIRRLFCSFRVSGASASSSRAVAGRT